MFFAVVALALLAVIAYSSLATLQFNIANQDMTLTAITLTDQAHMRQTMTNEAELVLATATRQARFIQATATREARSAAATGTAAADIEAANAYRTSVAQTGTWESQRAKDMDATASANFEAAQATSQAYSTSLTQTVEAEVEAIATEAAQSVVSAQLTVDAILLQQTQTAAPP